MKIPHWKLLILPLFLPLIGVLLNQLAMAVNGGQMPVAWSGGCSLYPKDSDTGHVCMTHATHLKFLCDWLRTSASTSSIGDYLIDVGGIITKPFVYLWCALMLVKRIYGEQ